MSHAFFDHFTRTNIISLQCRTDRRQDILKNLQRVGQSVDGKSVSWFDAIAPNTTGGFPSIGARGCFLSHLEVLRAARRDGVELLLILEDDAHFSKAFAAHHAAVLAALQSIDWDIFYAGYTPMTALPETGPVAAIAGDIPLQTSHAMALRQNAIDAAIPYLEAILDRPSGSPEGGPMHVDGAYYWFRKAHPALRTVIAVPQIITQRSSASDITPKSRLREAIALPFRRLRNMLS